jgi:hypothetical protein
MVAFHLKHLAIPKAGKSAILLLLAIAVLTGSQGYQGQHY